MKKSTKSTIGQRKPQIRKYDSVYNGRLSLCINGAKTFRDCRSYVLEDRLEDMMLSIYGEAEQVKQARLAREEAERQRQEQERKREEQRQQYNAEVDRTLALVNCAADYEIACRIPCLCFCYGKSAFGSGSF